MKSGERLERQPSRDFPGGFQWVEPHGSALAPTTWVEATPLREVMPGVTMQPSLRVSMPGGGPTRPDALELHEAIAHATIEAAAIVRAWQEETTKP